MSANGTNSRTLAASLDANGTPDWSSDGRWIVSGGIDSDGHQGLFKIAVDGDQPGEPLKLADGEAINPVWSPNDTVIVYAGPFAKGQASLLAVRPDGTPDQFAPVRVSPAAIATCETDPASSTCHALNRSTSGCSTFIPNRAVNSRD